MAGSVAYKVNKIRNGGELIEEHVWSWVGAAAGGAVTAKASNDVITGWVAEAETNPGSPSPTALYDITLTNADAADVIGGKCADRSATLTEVEMPLIGTGYGEKFVNSILTLNISGQSVNSAVGTFKIRVRKGAV